MTAPPQRTCVTTIRDMRSYSRLRPDLLALADSQMGLVTARQLVDLGVNPGTTSRRVAGGMWTRLLPGVHLLEGGHAQRLQLEYAALLYAGEPSWLTGLTALRLQGVRALRLQETHEADRERPEAVHVLIPHHRRRLSTGYVRVERTHRCPEATVCVQGMALAPVARAVADACRRLRRASDVRALATEVVQRELTTVEGLRRELDEGSRRGSALFREALVATAAGARSGPESDLHDLLRGCGLPQPAYNVTLVDAAGHFIAIADGWFDDVGLAYEVDSVEHHSLGTGFERTIRRNARYAAAGVPVVTILPRDVALRPHVVLRTLLDAYAAAAARPRPQVSVSALGRPTAAADGWRWGA